MILTVSYEPDPDSQADATALGHLLHKHPDRVQRFSAPVGDVHVLYPESSEKRCTAAVVLEVDPIALARSTRFRSDPGALGHYINDRPYVASSMLAVALGTVFRTAMTGRSDAFPELAAADLPLTISVPVVAVRGSEEDLVRRLFEPCGWAVGETVVPLDPAYPAWGASRYRSVTLRGRMPLARALRQVYVLLPVLDDTKHYWVSDDEVDKLERNGSGWLDDHPERALIARRYLLHQRALVEQAVEATDAAPRDRPLAAQRADAVLQALHDAGASSVVDMGCGPGALLARLAKDRTFRRIVGVDVSARSLETAARVLGLAQASDAERERIALRHGSVVYRDPSLADLDAMVLMEVIEHVDPSRLDALEDAVFGAAHPATVVVTTPNAEYNALYPGLRAGDRRHDDHRFEWTRAELRAWAEGIASRHGYRVSYRPVGAEDAALGAPTQLALFQREAAA
ncbi:3' terminal RNA ribose 2'-O-methyltransferase Hen1 [uncultured Amnibacterium sp.]|uniref:3' terminal RNA ribose 2'-O-methyltransferase Hen1 n=1 Tax=uncultured Amnibacterium sp. TaxID=1631851 RepID=UPI0035CAB518